MQSDVSVSRVCHNILWFLSKKYVFSTKHVLPLVWGSIVRGIP